MRLGTWNLEGKKSAAHREWLLAAQCDVWLLTEVDERFRLPGYSGHRTRELMAAGRRWAGIFSREPLIALPDPHPASAAAVIGGVTYCSSILPWRTCGGEPVWPGNGHAEKTSLALSRLVDVLHSSGEVVWGGDWNSGLEGPEHAGSRAGRAAIVAAAAQLGLQVPTAGLPHRIDGLRSIDHIAVDERRGLLDARRLDARGLSDHDGYVVELGGESP